MNNIERRASHPHTRYKTATHVGWDASGRRWYIYKVHTKGGWHAELDYEYGWPANARCTLSRGTLRDLDVALQALNGFSGPNYLA